jgi:aldehyde dehydrogenase (NAD+)
MMGVTPSCQLTAVHSCALHNLPAAAIPPRAALSLRCQHHDEFLDRFTHKIRGLKVGNPNDADAVIGPLINKGQLQRVSKLIATARGEGARQVLGGEPDGLVLPPHVFADVTNDMTIARDEIFGPVAPVIKVGSEEKALAVANATSYGLSAAVVTRD